MLITLAVMFVLTTASLVVCWAVRRTQSKALLARVTWPVVLVAALAPGALSLHIVSKSLSGLWFESAQTIYGGIVYKRYLTANDDRKAVVHQAIIPLQQYRVASLSTPCKPI